MTVRRIRTVKPTLPTYRATGSRGGFSHRQSSGGRDWLKIMIIAAVAVTVGGLFWLVIWGSPLRISEVSLSGGNDLVRQEIGELIEQRRATSRFGFLPQDNLLIFDVDGLRDDVERLVSLDSFTIDRRLPDQLTLNLSEKQTVAVWLAQGRFFAVDGSGDVIREYPPNDVLRLRDLPPGYDSADVTELGAEAFVAPTEGPAAAPPLPEIEAANPYPLIVDESAAVDDLPTPGEPAIDQALLTLTLSAHRDLPPAAADRIRWFTVRPGGNSSLEAAFAAGWRGFLTTTLPLETQAARLSLVLKEKVGARLNELEYVDLRLSEKIFLKFRNEIQPQNNQ